MWENCKRLLRVLVNISVGRDKKSQESSAVAVDF